MIQRLIPASPGSLAARPFAVPLFLLVLLLTVALRPAAGESATGESASGPDDVVRRVSDEILTVIETHRATFDDRPQDFYRAVDEQMAEFVDYAAIARAVMARYWADATEAQRERFVESFRRGLVRSYGRALLEFDQQRIEVLPVLDEHMRNGRALVRMEITGGNGRVYPLQYSMALEEGGTWKVRNVIVDGVNLGLTYRNQFTSAMQSGDSRGDLDEVIDNWSVAVDV